MLFKRNKVGLVGATLWLVIGGAARADVEYTFHLVDAFITSYGLRECYIYDISDNNVACGTATIQNGSMITYSGFYWTLEDEKTAVGISWPRGISNSGVIAGVTQLYDIPAGEFTTMPLLPATYFPLVMLDVNDAGLAVGYVQICNCSNSQGILQIPYIWEPTGEARTLAVAGANGLSRVNNNGLAIGWFGGWSASDSFVYDLNNDTYTVMSTVFPEPNTQTTAADINDLDVVVGSRKNYNGTVTYGYTWSAEAAVTLLPLPPAGFQPALHPSSINDAGHIVGSIYTPTGSSRAFVYDPAHGVRDLATLTVPDEGFVMMTATAINDNGWIAGYGYGGGGMYRSFVLTPIIAGDVDGDGIVGPLDLAAMLGSWGPCTACPGDLNADQVVDATDLAMLLGYWD